MGRSRWLFNAFAWGYDLITDQVYWERQIDVALDGLGELPEPRRVLDLGCGPGVSAFVLGRRLPAAEVVGIDIADRMIARARRNQRERYAQLDNVRFEVADASALPFADGSFDLALGHSFLYLVDDRPRVLHQVRRVLAPGGALVLFEPNRCGNIMRAAWQARGRAGALLRAPYAAGRFASSMLLWRMVSRVYGQMTAEEVRRLFEAAGFSRVDTRPTLGDLGLHCVGRVLPAE